MPVYIFLKRYWRPLLFLVIAVAYLISINIYGAKKYQAGFKDGSIKIQRKLDNVITEQAAQMAKASTAYQVDKATRDKANEVQYVEIEKIVREPVYINECIDDAGLYEINNAAGHK